MKIFLVSLIFITRKEFWVRDICSKSKKEENQLMDDLIKELSKGK